MPFAPLVAVGTLVFTFVNFLTYIRSRNWNGVLTQVIAWAAGVGAVMLAAHTQFASDVQFGSSSLDKMNIPTQFFLGLIATSLLTTVNEIKKAIDNSDSAQKAPLIAEKVPAGGPLRPPAAPSTLPAADPLTPPVGPPLP